MAVELRLVTHPAEIAGMRADWEHLLTRSSTGNVFLTFEWLSTWWRHYGGTGMAWVLAAYEAGQLVGLAPLMLRERRLAGLCVLRRVSFMGAGLSDRLDFLLASGLERPVLTAMLEHLAALRWDLVDLDEVPEDSMTARLLPGLAESTGVRVSIGPASVCPVIKLSPDPDAYLASLGSSTRANLRYYRRRLAKDHTVKVDIVTGGADVAEQLDAFLRVYRRCFEGRSISPELLSERFAAFRRDVATVLSARGGLLLGLLRVDDREVAAEFTFRHGGTCYGYNTCYDPAWKTERVRLLVQWEVIRHAITVGCREYDCLRGEEEYKYLWGAQPRRHVRIRLSRKNLKLDVLRGGARLLRSSRHL